MSKVEERGKEIMHAALNYANNLDDVKPIDDFSRNLCIALGQAFIKGAEWADEHQAEKDLELSWEDMFSIYRLVNEVLDDYADGKTKKEVGEEVLKRFKYFKERKENGTREG